ncbi:acylphosphatase-2-like isoform X2 [Dermacentor silvarum]|uniref:acylphosphatase-2-like isoform X2 n=1 Tax=Dermacentor silvarum TaxID=543639 RepID=UPI0021010333|nr:acylphosphatase-2-like isoform X2 [Dermacentor silvarum]
MLRSANFEVIGKVQGMLACRCTKDEADRLGLCGWVRNTSRGTVEGIIQGSADKMNNMKHWLSNVGSPQSVINSCKFTNEKTIDNLEFEQFSIKKTV